MKFYNWLIKYRLYIGIILILGGLALNLTVSGFWPVFPLYLVGVILVAGHFFFGPLRLIQVHMEEGNMEDRIDFCGSSFTIFLGKVNSFGKDGLLQLLFLLVSAGSP